jgi:hypothetical protein
MSPNPHSPLIRDQRYVCHRRSTKFTKARVRRVNATRSTCHVPLLPLHRSTDVATLLRGQLLE